MSAVVAGAVFLCAREAVRCYERVVCAHRASRVDVKKLEKQEAKLKVGAASVGRGRGTKDGCSFLLDRPRSRNARAGTCTRGPSCSISIANR